MEYSSSKPLSLQVYKTAAEFKAFRQNRTEQCRLDSARYYISRMERNFHKDFKTSKNKLESQHTRRLSVQESLVNLITSPRSATATPRGSAPTSVRGRVPPEIPSFSSARRSSVWSLPEILTQTKRPQNRRETYGGGSARFPSQSRFYGGFSVTKSKVSDCDFGDKLSMLVEPFKAGSLVDQRDYSNTLQPGQENGCPGASDRSEKDGSGCVVNGQAAVKRHGQDLACAAAAVTQEEVPATVTNSADGKDADGCATENGQLRGTTGSEYGQHSRRPSRTAQAAAVSSEGVANRIREADVVLVNNAPTEEESRTENQSNSNCAVLVPEAMPPSRNSAKSDRRVSIVEPPSKAVSTTPSVSTPSTGRLMPTASDDVKIYEEITLEHAKGCPAGEAENLRRNSVIFGTNREHPVCFLDFRRKSEPILEEPVLQSRVSQFLDQQDDFNKRFPLKRHEIISLECSRPDLLRVTRAREHSERQVLKAKAAMIAEVLEKLGMADCGKHESLRK